MPRPKLTSVRLAQLERPAAPNTLPAVLSVELCTLEPHGAPVHARPRFVTLTLTQPGREVTIAVRRVELAAVARGFASALRALSHEPTFEAGAGI